MKRNKMKGLLIAAAAAIIMAGCYGKQAGSQETGAENSAVGNTGQESVAEAADSTADEEVVEAVLFSGFRKADFKGYGYGASGYY